MKIIRLAILAMITLAISMVLKAQDTHKEATRGFDSLQVNIPHGKIDTISYNSKTVGTSRKAIIYTPPGFSKKNKYPFISDSDHRAIAGLSMGGGQSLNFGLGNLDTFAWVGGFSSAPNTKPPGELVPDPEEAKRKLKLLWLSCGDQDGLITFSKRTHDYLFKNDVPHIYYIEPGVHDFKVWKNGLYMFSQFLFKPVDPATFSSFHTGIGDPG